MRETRRRFARAVTRLTTLAGLAALIAGSLLSSPTVSRPLGSLATVSAPLWSTATVSVSTATVAGPRSPSAAESAPTTPSASTAPTTPTPASPGIGVFVSYADSIRANATNFPTPWVGSPMTTFRGCAPAASCAYDAGAVRVVNNSGSTVTVGSVAVHVSTCTYTGWAPASLPPGGDLIVTQLTSGAVAGCSGPSPTFMDTSDVGPGGINYSGVCTPDGILPTVDVTANGTTTSYIDSGQVLNAGGFDLGACPLGTNESTQWTLVGTGPCHGSLLRLAPPTQTHPVLTTATVTATFTNSCGQPLSDVPVDFSVQSGPNAGLTGAGVTDGTGSASFTYGSAHVGTDTLRASITNLAGTITSNAVTVIWTVSFAPGGGAFVIGDLENASAAHVLWWGAQWWKVDRMSTGLAPASFKGFERDNATPWCGESWTTRPGNSPHPPSAVPTMMAVIVSSHITKTGPTISGNIVHVVLVRTDSEYGPAPGHRGTGTIVAVLC